MKHKYSKTMKQLLKRPGNRFAESLILILSILSLCIVLAQIDDYRLEKSKIKAQIENPKGFDSGIPSSLELQFGNQYTNFTPTYSYSRLKLQYLSEPFASDSLDTIYYCIAIDSSNKPYVVGIREDEINKYNDLIDYTYNVSDKIPDTVVLKGMPTKISSGLEDMAIDELKSLYGNDFTIPLDASSVIGTLFLNTDQMPRATMFSDSYLSFIAFLLICFSFVYYKLIFPDKSNKKFHRHTIKNFNSTELKRVDQELSQPSTTYFSTQNLYITEHYIVNRTTYLEIIPMNEITHLYGCIPSALAKNNQTIIAVTNDGTKHFIANVITKHPSQTLDNNAATAIINTIKKYLPDITYGFDNDFYKISKPADMLNPDILDSDISNSSCAPKSNPLLGIIGAIIGALIGSVLWILIGKLGFIAGFAGFVMAVLAMRGYAILGGSIDKKGKIISISIALLMIFAANYTYYAISLCNSISFTELMDSYAILPRVLSKLHLWGDFSKDLIIGYLLSLWSCSKLIREAFQKESKTETC